VAAFPAVAAPVDPSANHDPSASRCVVRDRAPGPSPRSTSRRHASHERTRPTAFSTLLRDGGDALGDPSLAHGRHDRGRSQRPGKHTRDHRLRVGRPAALAPPPAPPGSRAGRFLVAPARKTARHRRRRPVSPRDRAERDTPARQPQRARSRCQSCPDRSHPESLQSSFLARAQPNPGTHLRSPGFGEAHHRRARAGGSPTRFFCRTLRLRFGPRQPLARQLLTQLGRLQLQL